MYQFTEDCLTGIERIDEEHRQLFAVINEAMDMLGQEGASLAAVKSLVRTLNNYAQTHFANEEAYMEQTNDPELGRQRREHAAFTKQIAAISLDAADEERGKELLKELLLYLSKWLYGHILGSDIMIGKFVPAEEDPFLFSDKYRTGIEFVDEEHKKLFDIIRSTNEAIHNELLHDKYDKILDILDELKDYTVMHFQDEENYMERIGYAAIQAQKNAHQAFVDKLNEIDLDDVDENQEEYLNDLIEYLRGWLVNHILRMDKLIPVK